MSTSTQKRFIDALLDLSGQEDVMMEHNTQFANTGRVRFTPKDKFEAVVEVAYDFQHTYCHIWASKGPLPQIVIGRNMNVEGKVVDRGCLSFDKLDEVLAEIRALFPR